MASMFSKGTSGVHEAANINPPSLEPNSTMACLICLSICFGVANGNSCLSRSLARFNEAV
jgi:hypothetical protein